MAKVRFRADVCERKKGEFTRCISVCGDHIYSEIKLQSNLYLAGTAKTGQSWDPQNSGSNMAFPWGTVQSDTFHKGGMLEDP